MGRITNKIAGILLLSIALITYSCSSDSTNDPTINNTVKTAGTLDVSTTTSTYNGKYSPRHVLAIWVESSSGTFVKTLMVYAAARKQYLTNWLKSTSSGNSTDAITGATLSSHGTRTCTWDGTDSSGNTVGDGTYNVCMEFTENDGTGKYASFSFTKGTSTASESPSASNYFSAISLNWTPSN